MNFSFSHLSTSDQPRFAQRNIDPAGSRRSRCQLGVAIACCWLSSASFAAISSGDLIITEVMANPSAVSDTRGEWFEVFNASGNTLDLAGLTIRDEGSNLHTLDDSAPLSLLPGDFFVLGRDADSNSNGGYSADYVYSSFTLGNSSDAIILESDGTVVDSLSYSGSGVFGEAGISAEWTPGGFALTPAGLVFGDGDTGTPGTAGSYTPPVSSVPLPASAWLMGSAIAGLFASRRTRRT